MSNKASFKAYLSSNPEVYDRLVTLARSVKNSGMKKCGIAMIYEVVRYEGTVSNNGKGKYKLPNAYRAGYARLIMDRETDLAGFFRTARSEFDN